MAKATNCPICGGQPAVRWTPGTGAGRFLVWVECEGCGTHTARYMDSGNPSEDSPGGKWAILAWNSGEHNTDRKKV